MFQPAALRNLAMPACALFAVAAAGQPTSAEPARAFTTECGSLALDLKSNRSICTNLRISDGETTITAAEGTTDATSFEDSQWLFTGNVRISFGTAMLEADQARFRFSNNELVHGELTGSPVTITDYIEEQRAPVRGSADAIRFDNRGGTAELAGAAKLALGGNEYSGCDLVYHLTDKTFNSGSSDCGVRVIYFPPDSSPSEPAQAP